MCYRITIPLKKVIKKVLYIIENSSLKFIDVEIYIKIIISDLKDKLWLETKSEGPPKDGDRMSRQCQHSGCEISQLGKVRN